MIKKPMYITNPVGIDFPIQQLQITLDRYLSTLWNISDYLSFGKCFVNNGIPQVYFNNGEYIPVFACDNYSAISFFYPKNNSIPIANDNTQLIYTSEVDLIFFVNIKKIKPNLNHYGNEEIKEDIIRLITNTSIFKILNIVEMADNVLKEFEYDNNKTKIDMYPYFCVKFELEITYQYNFSKCYN